MIMPKIRSGTTHMSVMHRRREYCFIQISLSAGFFSGVVLSENRESFVVLLHLI